MTRRHLAGLAALTALTLTLAACGGGSDNRGAAPGTRTITIEMRDIAFSPDRVEVRAGEKVRFVFRNRGKATHEAFVGDEKAQDGHEMEMRQGGSMSGMGHEGSEEGGISVAPGKTGEITHTFRAGDTVLIGCHQPGHYAAGMKMMVNAS